MAFPDKVQYSDFGAAGAGQAQFHRDAPPPSVPAKLANSALDSRTDKAASLKGRVDWPKGKALLTSIFVIGACIGAAIFFATPIGWIVSLSVMVLSLAIIWTVAWNCRKPSIAAQQQQLLEQLQPPLRTLVNKFQKTVIPKGYFSDFITNSHSTRLTDEQVEAVIGSALTNILGKQKVDEKGDPIQTPFEDELWLAVDAYRVQHPEGARLRAAASQRQRARAPQRIAQQGWSSRKHLGLGYIQQELIAECHLGLGGNPHLTLEDVQRQSQTFQREIETLYQGYTSPEGGEMPNFEECVRELLGSGLRKGNIDIIIRITLRAIQGDEEPSPQYPAFADALTEAVGSARTESTNQRRDHWRAAYLTPFFRLFRGNGGSLDGLKVGRPGDRMTFDAFLEHIHGPRLMVSDHEIDAALENAFTLIDNQTESFNLFCKAVRIQVKKFRYLRLLEYLHGTHQDPRIRVVLQETRTRGDGNCFLDACSKGLTQITNGDISISYQKLRKSIGAQFIRLFSEQSPRGRRTREHFMNFLIGGELGCGISIPELSAEESGIIDQAGGLLKLAKMNEEDIAGLPGMRQGDLTAAIKLRFKARKNYALRLNEREEGLLLQYGYNHILNSENTQTLIDNLGNLFNVELFRYRLNNIFRIYHEGLTQDHMLNSPFEASLVAHTLQRPVVILNKGERKNRILSSRGIYGAEYFDEEHPKAPITLLFERGHYTVGYYPQHLLQARG